MSFNLIISIVLLVVLFSGFFYIELSRILEKKSCKVKIVGELNNISVERKIFRHVMETHMYFNYKFEGKEYKNICALDSDYISKKNRNKLIKGSEYNLYINPKKPENICYSDRKYYVRDILSAGLVGFPLLVSLIAIMEIIL